jgi:hypothetical protein
MKINPRPYTFLADLGPLNGQNILFFSHAKYLIEMIEAKVFRTCIITYYLYRSERLSANIKLNLHKAPIISVMTYACPALELVANTYLLKLQRLQNKVLRTDW